MSRRSLGLLLLCLAVWLAACYGVRFAFMEDSQWVGVCAESAGLWQCQLRSALGLMIHWRVLAWLALLPALLGNLFLCFGNAVCQGTDQNQIAHNDRGQ